MHTVIKLFILLVVTFALHACGDLNSESEPSQDNDINVPANDEGNSSSDSNDSNGGNTLIFLEDFESGSKTNSFDSLYYGSFMSNPDFILETDHVISGTYALSYNYQVDEDADDGYATQHFGDSTKTPVYSNGAGNHYHEIYLQYKVYYSEGFDFSFQNNKQFIIGSDDGTRHDEACCNPWVAHYATLKVGSGYFHAEANNKRGASGQWVPLNPNDNGYNDSNGYRVETERWYLVEAHILLNDIGEQNGVFEQWIDGERITYRDDVVYRVLFDSSFGTDFNYGINFIMHSNYINEPVTQEQAVFYDDIKLSTSYIGQ